MASRKRTQQTRLEQLRLDAGLTPQELGAQVGIAGQTIRRIESGNRAHPATLFKLAQRFDVPASSLPQPALQREAA